MTGAEDRDHDEHEEIRGLREADESEEAVDFLPLRGEDRDDHAHDERDRREAREDAKDERRAAEELAVPDEVGVKAWRRDTELGEEARDLLDVVDLAPARRHEYEAHGE